MKRLLLLPVILAVFSGANAQQKSQIKADSEITNVTVFLNSAQITRETKVMLNPGSNQVSFERLSAAIIPGSIQVEGSDQFTITSVNSEKNYLSEGSERPEVKAMKKELNRVNDEIKQNQAYMRVYQEQQELLVMNHVFKGENKGITVEEMLGMSEMYRTKLWEIQEKMYDCELKGRRMNTELSKIQKQVNELETKFNRYTSVITLNLSAAAKVNAKVKITYLVSNAGWSANYDAKAKDLSTPLELVLKASVTQTTGEDWNNVKLKLSTGNPRTNKTKPELIQWNLYAYDEIVYRNSKKGKSKAYEMTTEETGKEYEKGEMEDIPASVKLDSKKLEKAADERYDNKTTYSYTTMVETGVNAEYEISIPYSILSDGKQYTVEIKKYDIPAAYSHYAVPKLDKDAFLVATLTDWEKYNLIPGYVNVYINNTYTGRSYFDSQSVEDTLELSMGRDQSVVIDRKKIKEFCGTSVIGGNKKSGWGYEITVRNTRKNDISIKLSDQFPLSSFKEMEVSAGEYSGAKYNKETGKLEWELNIKAGESKKVNFNYSVKYPKDKMITNLGG